ncbi:MAG: phosphopentomutase [Gammaproteobacteria bacterium RIFCSPHIGHO2_12_FULL_43_28]|nr:MAG: phosphopentomutase [Gammaproteobacteria bacterium RIFCSPHIGHO2_12_FULL_43_28]
MPRAFVIMLDSFGLGATADADKYGDQGADTIRHIAEWCQAGKADKAGVRSGPLHLPNLTRLGLNGAAMISQGKSIPGLDQHAVMTGAYGCAEELSLGKDTQSGHWEMAGVPVLFEWGYFKQDNPCFPPELLNDLIGQAKLPGVLGNKHASGTVILEELGELHQKTGKPIVYTSADSVFQIAAHEESFGLDRLYEVCAIARKLVDDYHIGRVIARPFLGTPNKYYRTGNRHDYAVPPPSPTLLDDLVAAGGSVIAIGKVADIYAHHGITKEVKADGNKALFETFINEAKNAPDKSLTFVNLVDFDMVFGHRRDVIGYAKALEDFDSWLPSFEKILKPGDMAIITADHGCDPTWIGSDHTREHVPVLAFGPDIKAGSLGLRKSFADIGQSIAKHLGLAPLKYGVVFG